MWRSSLRQLCWEVMQRFAKSTYWRLWMLPNLHQGPQKLFTWGRECNLYIEIHCSCLWNCEGVVLPFFTQRKLTTILWILLGRMASLCEIHPRGNCERNRKSKIQVTNLQANRPHFSQKIPAIAVLNLKRRIPPSHFHICAEEVQSQNHGLILENHGHMVLVLVLAQVWEMIPLRRTRQRILSWKDQLKLSQLWPLKSELHIPFIWLSRSPFKFVGAVQSLAWHRDRCATSQPKYLSLIMCFHLLCSKGRHRLFGRHIWREGNRNYFWSKSFVFSKEPGNICSHSMFLKQ